MKETYLKTRLEAIRKQLCSVYNGGDGLSSSSIGREREVFLSHFLSEVMPQSYRFGFGDIIDESGKKSGQVDIVIENQFFPSLPLVGSSSPRLYLAESVLAAIEVKSNIRKEFDDALRTAKKIKSLTRDVADGYTEGIAKEKINIEIPVFAVGYTGWKTVKKVEEKLNENKCIDGILVVDPGIFVYRDSLFEGNETYLEGDSLWGLIRLIYGAGIFMLLTSYDIGKYVKSS